MYSGLPEILLIVLVAFLLFGARKRPDAARSIGKALNEFKRGFRESPADSSTGVSHGREREDDHVDPDAGR